jgi:transposase-like protein
MDKSLFSAEHFHKEDTARAMLERLRWPNGPACPHCGATKYYRLNVRNSKRSVLKCAKCRKQFSVTVGTIFEDSHIPLNIWFQAIQLMCSSKKGFSAHELHRTLGITYKSAWFLAHRIRHAMTESVYTEKLSGTIEADETFIGGKVKGEGVKAGKDKKFPVFSLLQRGGKVRSFAMPRVTAKNLKQVIKENVNPQSTLMTDSFIGYRGLKKDYARHEMVDHSSEEYVRGDAYTNTVESYFSLLKRGIIGTYHHVSKKHLPRYLAEFDFRYNARTMNDLSRSVLAVTRTEGKRLQYQ